MSERRKPTGDEIALMAVTIALVILTLIIAYRSP
jgi:hypothetical protein